MQLFTLTEATHFCSSFVQVVGDAGGALITYANRHLRHNSLTVQEGSAAFTGCQSCMLREAERNLFLATSQYRRALDLMIPSASHWGHVTLYYGAWFAAHALLAMHGCILLRQHVVDVEIGTPGAQALRIRSFGNAGLCFQRRYGSHNHFWQLFYDITTSLRPQLAPGNAASITPISGDPFWLTDHRNEINYNTHSSILAGGSFPSSFTAQSMSACLSGPLATQWEVTEKMLLLAFELARQYGLQTDSIAQVYPSTDLRTAVKEQVFHKKAPSLVGKTSKKAICAT
jgi:hypothetical protein